MTPETRDFCEIKRNVRHLSAFVLFKTPGKLSSFATSVQIIFSKLSSFATSVQIIFSDCDQGKFPEFLDKFSRIFEKIVFRK